MIPATVRQRITRAVEARMKLLPKYKKPEKFLDDLQDDLDELQDQFDDEGVE